MPYTVPKMGISLTEIFVSLINKNTDYNKLRPKILGIVVFSNEHLIFKLK